MGGGKFLNLLFSKRSRTAGHQIKIKGGKVKNRLLLPATWVTVRKVLTYSQTRESSRGGRTTLKGKVEERHAFDTIYLCHGFYYRNRPCERNCPSLCRSLEERGREGKDKRKGLLFLNSRVGGNNPQRGVCLTAGEDTEKEGNRDRMPGTLELH